MVKTADFPEVYKSLGINPFDLGCIMLDVEKIAVRDLMPDSDEDLYYSKDPDLKYAQGPVGETKAHLTLLYGLTEKGPKWRKQVDAVLESWKQPDFVIIRELAAFPSSKPGEDYSCIVAKILPTPSLIEANQRIRLLPHIDGFPDYTPHVTVAYVNKSDEAKWLEALGPVLKGRRLKTLGINYGGTD